MHPLWDVAFTWFQRHRERVRDLLAPFDLAPMQMHALRALEPGVPRPMAEVAAAIHCDPANITSVIGRLTERALVTRAPDPRDGRVRAVLLTPEGARVRAALLDALVAPPAGVEHLTAAEQRQLRSLLERTLGPPGG